MTSETPKLQLWIGSSSLGVRRESIPR